MNGLDTLPRPGAVERFLADDTVDPAGSLRASAAKFRAMAQEFSADLSERMARDADVIPALYRDFARQQAERAERLAA